MENFNFLHDEEVLWQGTSSLSYERVVIKYIGLICSTPIIFMLLIDAFIVNSPIILVPYIILIFGANIFIFLIIRMYLRSYTERLKEPPEFYITNKRIISKDPDTVHKKYIPEIPSGIKIKEKSIIMDIDNLSKVKFIKFRKRWNSYFYLEKLKNASWWIQFDGLDSIDMIKAILTNIPTFQCVLKKKKKEIYSKV